MERNYINHLSETDYYDNEYYMQECSDYFEGSQTRYLRYLARLESNDLEDQAYEYVVLK